MRHGALRIVWLVLLTQALAVGTTGSSVGSGRLSRHGFHPVVVRSMAQTISALRAQLKAAQSSRCVGCCASTPKRLVAPIQAYASESEPHDLHSHKTFAEVELTEALRHAPKSPTAPNNATSTSKSIDYTSIMRLRSSLLEAASQWGSQGVQQKHISKLKRMMPIDEHYCTWQLMVKCREDSIISLKLRNLGFPFKVPVVLSEFPELTSLAMFKAKITGRMPDLSSLPKLKYLMLRGEDFSEIPKLPKSLKNLVLFSNNGASTSGVFEGNLRSLRIRSRYLSAKVLDNLIGSSTKLEKLSVRMGNLVHGDGRGFFNGTLPVSVVRQQGLVEFGWRIRKQWGAGDAKWNITDFPNPSRMEQIALSGLGLTEVPSFLIEARRAKSIDLSINSIRRVPDWIASIPSDQLSRLSFKDNQLQEKPKASTLVALERLNPRLSIIYTGNSAVYDRSKHLKNTQQFMEDLRSMTNVSMPASPNTMKEACSLSLFNCERHPLRVTKISLKGLALSDVPESLLLFSGLKVLDLEENFFTRVPEVVLKMKQLETLVLRMNLLESLEASLFKLPLRVLVASENRINKLPDEEEVKDGYIYRGIATLNDLELQHNNISSFPRLVFNMNLMNLDLTSNSIHEIPKDIYKMGTSLKNLKVGSNRLTDESILGVTWPRANGIFFDLNSLTTLPVIDVRVGVSAGGKEEAGRLPFLSFEANRISSISARAAQNMKELHVEVLVLKGNIMEAIPSELVEFPIQKIDLSDNMIRSISGNVWLNLDARELDLGRNEIEAIEDLEDEVGMPLYAQKKSLRHKGALTINLDSNRIRKIGRGFPYMLEKYRNTVDVYMPNNPTEDLAYGFGVSKPSSSISLDHTVVPFIIPTMKHNVEAGAIENIVEKFEFAEEDEVLFPAIEVQLASLARSSASHNNVLFAGKWDVHVESIPLYKDCHRFKYRISGVIIAVHSCVCKRSFYKSMENSYKCRQCPELAKCEFGEAHCPPKSYMAYLDDVSGSLSSEMKCEDCPEGGTCDGNTITPVTGFFKLTSASHEVFECPNPAACQGGDESKCAEGYTGVLCGQCEHGYFQSGAHTCARCPEPAVSISFFILSVMGVLAAAIIVFLLAASIIEGRSSKQSKRDARMANVVSSFKSTEFFKMAISFLQIITSLNLTFDLDWPMSLNFLDEIFGWVSLDVMKATSLECVWEMSSNTDIPSDTMESSGFGYMQKVAFATSVPLGVSTLLLTIYWTVKLAYRIDMIRKRQVISIASLKRIVVNNNLLVWQLCYLPVSFMCIQYFHCVSFDSNVTWYIKNDLSTQCYTPAYWKYAPVAVTGLVLYTIGMPALVIAYIVVRRKHLNDPAVLQSVGSIYRPYKREYAYWEAVEMIRKVTIGGGVVILNGSATFQVTVSLAILFMFMIVHCRFWPNTSKTSNIIQAALLTLTYFTMCLGLLKTLEVPPGQRSLFSGVIVGLDFMAVCVIMCLILYDLSGILKEKIQSLQKSMAQRAALARKIALAAAQGAKKKNRDTEPK